MARASKAHRWTQRRAPCWRSGYAFPTPQAPTPEAILETSLELIGRFGWDGPVGVGFPGVVKRGVVHTASKVAKELIGFDLQGRLQRESGNTVRVIVELGKWAKRLNEYLVTMDALFWPDLIVVGGGVSKKGDKFIPKLETRAKIVPARMLNIAGIAGAALAPEAVPQHGPQVATSG